MGKLKKLMRSRWTMEQCHQDKAIFFLPCTSECREKAKPKHLWTWLGHENFVFSHCTMSAPDEGGKIAFTTCWAFATCFTNIPSLLFFGDKVHIT